jgi:hypothetical protein
MIIIFGSWGRRCRWERRLRDLVWHDGAGDDQVRRIPWLDGRRLGERISWLLHDCEVGPVWLLLGRRFGLLLRLPIW